MSFLTHRLCHIVPSVRWLHFILAFCPNTHHPTELCRSSRKRLGERSQLQPKHLVLSEGRPGRGHNSSPPAQIVSTPTCGTYRSTSPKPQPYKAASQNLNAGALFAGERSSSTLASSMLCLYRPPLCPLIYPSVPPASAFPLWVPRVPSANFSPTLICLLFLLPDDPVCLRHLLLSLKRQTI